MWKKSSSEVSAGILVAVRDSLDGDKQGFLGEVISLSRPKKTKHFNLQ
jgi:hypothetical protein